MTRPVSPPARMVAAIPGNAAGPGLLESGRDWMKTGWKLAWSDWLGGEKAGPGPGRAGYLLLLPECVSACVHGTTAVH